MIKKKLFIYVDQTNKWPDNNNQKTKKKHGIQWLTAPNTVEFAFIDQIRKTNLQTH